MHFQPLCLEECIVKIMAEKEPTTTLGGGEVLKIADEN